MYILCTTGSLHCGIFRVSITYMHCGYVQFCDMSVGNPLVTPIHIGTTCNNMVNILQNGCMCVLKDIVNKKQLFDINLAW